MLHNIILQDQVEWTGYTYTAQDNQCVNKTETLHNPCTTHQPGKIANANPFQSQVLSGNITNVQVCLM